MKRKGILSGVLVICIMLSMITGIPVFAAEEDSNGLEQAIIAAKSIITVPDNYTEFNNHLSQYETSNGKVQVWDLQWQEKEGKNGFVSVTIGKDGFLYEYNKYSGDENSNGLAKITKDQAQKLAEEFLKKAIPSYSDQMKKVDNKFNEYSSDQFNFTYQKYVNDAPVNFVTVNIGVNKYSGEVTDYNGGNPEVKGIQYPTLEGTISLAEGEKAYIEKLGVNLKYYSYYDYKQKKMNVFAGYSIDDNKNKSIDAKTGQVVSNYREDRFYKDKVGNKGLANTEDSVADSKAELTKEETDEIKNVSNLISKEKAESILRETSDAIQSNMKVNDVSLRKDRISNEYIWNISFENAYGRVDAKSGEVLSLYCYTNDDTNAGNKKISNEEAKNIAETFLKKVSPNKFTQTKYEENEKIIDKEETSSSFRFIRQVNGIEFSNNSLQVEVDNATGKVVGYSNRWYDNVSFPDISKAMGKDAAFNKIKGLSDFGLKYTMLDKSKVGLVYDFKNTDDSYIIDPISGIRLDYTGQAYKENKLPEYTDINGHWCEKIVKELLNNGYYLDGDKFNPNVNITQINFFKYLYSNVKSNYNSDDEFYEMLIQNGVVKKEEKAPNSALSNQDAAKFIIRYLGYDKIAVHPEIFNNPFKDTIEENYKGYAAMCYGLNIMKGTDGNFNGTHNISNAEAAAIIYNLISMNSNKR